MSLGEAVFIKRFKKNTDSSFEEPDLEGVVAILFYRRQFGLGDSNGFHASTVRLNNLKVEVIQK